MVNMILKGLVMAAILTSIKKWGFVDFQMKSTANFKQLETKEELSKLRKFSSFEISSSYENAWSKSISPNTENESTQPKYSSSCSDMIDPLKESG